MTKEENKSLDGWARLAASLYLSQQPEEHLQDNRNDTGNRGDDGTQPYKAFTPVHLSETALVYYHPSFVGYLEAAWNLLKQAFRHKERGGLHSHREEEDDHSCITDHLL